MKIFKDKTPYPYVIDHKPGFLLSWILYRLFQRVSVDEKMKESLRQLHRQGTVVYAIKYRGHLDYLLYHYNYRRNRLPYPRLAFDLNMSLILPLGKLFKIVTSRLISLIRFKGAPNPYSSGFYKKAIRDGVTSLIFLVDPKRFSRQFVHSEQDHIQLLLEVQQEMEKPIFIVPQLTLYDQIPEKKDPTLIDILFGLKDKPGVIRKIALFFRYYRQAFIDFGQPINLKELLEDQNLNQPPMELATRIRQELIESIDNQKRVILGPIMKSRQQLKEIVLTDPQINEKIKDMTAGDKKKQKKLRQKTGEYFDEIAADYNSNYVEFLRLFLNWVWKNMFQGIEVDRESLAQVRLWARKGPLIYVPSHRSHIDYLILNYVLFINHMHVPRIAAGKNLTFWPMGHFFRKCGAFFIRRTFKGARLYSEVFSRYIKALLEEGHPIEFFIEGGRSRNGKAVQPTTGFLAILLQAHLEGFCDNLIVIPTSITYDRIIEGKSYLDEIRGHAKEKESLRQMINARRFLKRRYGKIYVRFNQPFFLKDYINKCKFSEKDLKKELASHIIQSINEVSVVTPLSLIATAILSNHRRGFHFPELMATVQILLEFLRKKNAPVSAALNNLEDAVSETLTLLTGWKIADSIIDESGIEECFYFINEDNQMELEYYKNSIIHYFIDHALVATSLLSSRDEEKSRHRLAQDYAFLRHLLQREFVFDEGEEKTALNTDSLLDDFFRSGLISPTGDKIGYFITSKGFDQLPIWAELAKTFLESYWIAAWALSRQKNGKVKGSEILKNINALGKKFHKSGVIEHIGALSQLNFKNALGVIDRIDGSILMNIESNLPDKQEGLSQLSKRIYELAHY